MKTAKRRRFFVIVLTSLAVGMASLGVWRVLSIGPDGEGVAGSDRGAGDAASDPYRTDLPATTQGESPITTAANVPSGPPPRGARAIGADTCSFISTADIEAAVGATPVELRQSGSGVPGCEWVVGTQREPLQLEFADPNGAPLLALPTEGEDVPGPWARAKWLSAIRTMHVQSNNLSFIVRVSNEDLRRAREIGIQVALLVTARN